MGGLETRVANLLADAPEEVSSKILSKMKTILEDKVLVDRMNTMENEELVQFLKEVEVAPGAKSEEPHEPLAPDIIP